MGMAASQARLLSLTARIHDVEYQAQAIQNQKLQLATLEDEAYRKYNDALDATTLTFTNDAGTLVPANFNNLCGKASINNNMSKNYVFRTGDLADKLIVPDEIFNAYEKFGGDDPYAFAMYMMGVNDEQLDAAKQKYINEISGSSTTNDGKDTMREIVEKIAKLADPQSDAKATAKHVVDENESIEQLRPKNPSDSNYDEICDLIDEYNEEKQKYLNSVYKKGAGKIYEYATNDTDGFDEEKYEYYLRWGMLIENEVGLDGCVSSSDYGDDFNSDQEMLNYMLQSGRIRVDTVEFTSDGSVKEDSATVGSDSRLTYTPTTSIDKKALAKAEAEYEHTMKEIDRKDKRFDMDLNKLETERTALTTEYDSVKKVIQENIERTFGIFS